MRIKGENFVHCDLCYKIIGYYENSTLIEPTITDVNNREVLQVCDKCLNDHNIYK